MAEVTVRELRRHAGTLVDRAASGERITITRFGIGIAELRPGAHPPVPAGELLHRWRNVPRIDLASLRAEIDAIIDPTL